MTPAKRAFDIILSSAVMLLSLPLAAAVALAIILDTGGPVFYRTTRIGQAGKPFTILKFRTMVENAESLGPGITRRGDPRITRVGRHLRRLRIDEMPQLINVLRGEMSIVGPRPEDPRHVALYTPEQRRVLTVQPGLASPAFTAYRHEEDILAAAGDRVEQVYLAHILPSKLALDLEYVKNHSFVGDLGILVRAALPRGRDDTV